MNIYKMSFQTIKSVDDRAKLVNNFLQNRAILKKRLLDKKLGDQALQKASEKLYEPVTSSVEKAQKATDKKQTKMIEQLQENQDNITGAIDTLSEAISTQGSTRGVESWLGKQPSQFDDLEPIEEEDDEGAVGVTSLHKTRPFGNQFSNRLIKLGVDPTITIIPTKYAIDEKIDKLNQLIKESNSQTKIKTLGNLKETLKKYQKIVSTLRKTTRSEKEVEFVPDEDVLETPKTNKKSGTGLMKLNTDHMFGNLYVDPAKLLEMRIEAYNNSGKKVMSHQIDHSFLELLTKRYNPRRAYTENAENIFSKLIKLSGISPYTSKSGKIGLGKTSSGCNKSIKYYNDPNQLCERLELIIASRAAGNNNKDLINEAVEIIDKLRNDQTINDSDYKQLYNSII